MSRTRTALSRGYAISYEDAGQGFPVALIPGYMQSAADYVEAGYLERLAVVGRVLVIDPLGHGKSDKPHDPVPYRAPGLTADLIAVLDNAGLDKVALWGYSRGAYLAGMTAIEYPHRLSALIVGGGSLTYTPPIEIPQWVDPLSRGDWPGFFSLFPIPLSLEVQRHFEEGNDPKALAASAIGRIESPYVFHLDRVTVPSLVYCGGDDGPEDAIPTAQLLGTEVRVLEGCDHFAASAAIDQIMPIAIEFLDSMRLLKS